MNCINQAIKDIFSDTPSSFEDAVQSALGTIPEGVRGMPSEEDDDLREGIIETFSHIKTDKNTVDKVMREISKLKQR